MRWRRIFARAAGILVLGALCCTLLAVPLAQLASAAPLEPRANPIPPSASGCYAGAYVATGGLAAFNVNSGKNHAIFLKFVGVGLDGFDVGGANSVRTFCNTCYSLGAVPYLTIQPSNATASSLLKPADVTWLNDFATQIGGLRRPVFIRFGHEMNGDWYPWGWTHVTPDVYIRGYQQVAAIFRQRAPKAAMVWAPSQDWGDNCDHMYSNWYPGDAYVDWVGLTSYQWPYSHVSSHQFYFSVANGEEPEADFYATFAVGHDKPMMIAETASGDDDPGYYDSPDKLAAYGVAPGQGAQNWWISQVYSVGSDQFSMRTAFPRIGAVTWFAHGDFAIGGTDLTQHSTGFSTYAAALSDPYWLSDAMPPLTITITGVSEGAQYSHDVTPGAASNDPSASVGGTLDGSTWNPGEAVSDEGNHTLSVNATDVTGDSASQTVHFTVDKTPPVVTVPVAEQDLQLEATGPGGAPVTFHPMCSDNIDPAPELSMSQPNPHTYPLGSTVVTFSATDAAGNTSSTNATVTVRDTTAPVLDVPSDMVLEGTGPGGAVASFTVTAADIVDGVLAATCAPPSGSTFHVGSTVVSCRATDTAGNAATKTFSVTVRDTTPPTLSLPSDMVLEATGPSGAVATWTATATDLVDGPLPVVSKPPSGSTFPLGSSTVSCTASDSAHNAASATFRVTVIPAVNHAPVANDDATTCAQDARAVINVLANDTDVDTTHESLTVTSVVGPSNGTLRLAATGEATYTPRAGFFGTDAFTYCVFDGELSSAPATVTITVTRVGAVGRIGGSDRYAVAAGLARAGWDPTGNGTWPGVAHIVVACGDPGKEADQLCAAGLAGVHDAPVLLVKARLLPPSTKSTIKSIASRNPGVRIHVVGGTASVPDARVREITAIAGVNKRVDRLGGADRYGVSAAIARRMVSLQGPGAIPGVILVSAENRSAFYDALAASPIAYAKHMPMLAVRKASIPASIKSVLSGPLSARPRYAASGPTYLGASASGAHRLAMSPNRYAAAVSIAGAAVSAPKSWLSLANTGLAAVLPDSVTGGAFMGKRGGVLLFTDSSTTMQIATRAYISANKARIGTGWIFGGSGSVTNPVQTKFWQLLK